jgi:hypothetical protein
MVRSITTALAAVALLTCLVGPAEAFDGGTCNSIFGAGNIGTVRQFTIDTGSLGKVDFGDHLHLFGEPRGTAVVCWHKTGPVAVRGYVFADSLTDITWGAKVTYFTSGGVVVGSPRDFFFVGGAYADAGLVSDTRTDAGITKVRITLLRGTGSGFVVVPGGTKDLGR